MTRPTPDDVETAARLLGKAALLDPRISASDEGTIMAWAEVIAPANLGLDELLPTIAEHYAMSNERIMPSDVLRRARAHRNDRLARTVGNDTAPPAPALPPASTSARRAAIDAAIAQIGRDHDPDRGRTLPHKPTPAFKPSQATIAAKVAKARASAPPKPLPPDRPDPDVKCHLVNAAPEAINCLLAAGHLGPHHPQADA